MANKTRIFAFALLFCAGTSLAVLAQTSDQGPPQTPEQVFKSLNFQTGTVVLDDNLAKLNLNDRFRYLDPTDTEKFLTEVWQNPPSQAKDTLGTILPLDPSPLTAEGWAVIINYEAVGYVSDEDAGKIDYDDLMKQMQQALSEANDERVKQGYERIALLGWARKPYYDAKTKKMYWAKRLRFGNSPDEQLNYEIRVLGRHGVLDLNIVAPMTALSTIDDRINTILAMVDFNKGNTYAEYNPKIDKAAEYGLAGLVAGGILAKVGFFKGLLVLLAAGWKFVVIGFLAVVAAVSQFFKKLFGRKSA